MASAICVTAAAQTPASTDSTGSARIERGSILFLEPMDGFETYLSAALMKKKVPVVILDDRSKADFVVTGTSHVERASWAKTIFISGAPQAAASISIKNARSGNLVFAYSVDKFNAARASQSTAEACAKHLKDSIEKK